MSRRHKVAELASIEVRPLELATRQPTTDDREALAELMLDAYAGTIDADGSETLGVARDEVDGYLNGASGPPILAHSLVALDADDNRPIAAVLVSRFEGMPLIAYAMTAASHKGRGVATALTERVMRSLHAAGESKVHLWVTRGNVPAETIYERLGFRDVDP